MADKKTITLNELAQKNAGKILPDNRVQDCKISIADETVLFSFKPIRKKQVIKGQAKGDEEQSDIGGATHKDSWKGE